MAPPVRVIQRCGGENCVAPKRWTPPVVDSSATMTPSPRVAPIAAAKLRVVSGPVGASGLSPVDDSRGPGLSSSTSAFRAANVSEPGGASATSSQPSGTSRLATSG